MHTLGSLDTLASTDIAQASYRTGNNTDTPAPGMRLLSTPKAPDEGYHEFIIGESQEKHIEFHETG